MNRVSHDTATLDCAWCGAPVAFILTGNEVLAAVHPKPYCERFQRAVTEETDASRYTTELVQFYERGPT